MTTSASSTPADVPHITVDPALPSAVSAAVGWCSGNRAAATPHAVANSVPPDAAVAAVRHTQPMTPTCTNMPARITARPHAGPNTTITALDNAVAASAANANTITLVAPRSRSMPSAMMNSTNAPMATMPANAPANAPPGSTRPHQPPREASASRSASESGLAPTTPRPRRRGPSISHRADAASITSAETMNASVGASVAFDPAAAPSPPSPASPASPAAASWSPVGTGIARWASPILSTVVWAMPSRRPAPSSSSRSPPSSFFAPSSSSSVPVRSAAAPAVAL